MQTQKITKKVTKLGILGGGQLAQMLALNNPYEDLKIVVLSESAECPAKDSPAEIQVGSVSDPKSLQQFIDAVDFITFENEFLETERIQESLQTVSTPKLFFPSLETLKIVQNKLSQKYLFQKLHILSSPFTALDPLFDMTEVWLQNLFTLYPQGCMIKWSQGGYDGKGNFLLKQKKQIQDALEFCKMALSKKATVYAEQLVTFQKETAMVFCRSFKGEFISYPLVVSEQENNICKIVFGPAVEFGISAELEQRAREYGRQLAEHLSYVGTFALEFFVTENNELMVNEMAPRVHNSGHYTLEACLHNQFANHIRAGMGDALGASTFFPFFAMLNILGQSEAADLMPPQLPFEAPYKLHWYSKKGSRQNRKLGHLNTVATSKDDLQNKINKMTQFESTYWKK